MEVRAGAQLSDLWSVLYQGSAAYGTQVFTLYGEPAQLITHSSSFLGEVTLADMVQIALGPSLGFGSIHGRTHVGGGRAPQFYGGMGVGFSHRVAVTWGGTGTGTRQGFSLALNLDALWLVEHGNPGFGSLRLAFGWESF